MRQRLFSSNTERDEQSGDDADHAQSVAAEPDCNYCYKPEI